MSIRLILEALSGHDYRVTWQRWAVAAHIALQGDQLFTVDELFHSLRRHYPEIGLTTVYRTLDLLVELGIIDRVHGTDGVTKYCVRAPGVHSHQTLVCENCGTMKEVDIEQIPPLLRSFAQREDFALSRFEVTLYGQCADCQREEAAALLAGRERGQERENRENRARENQEHPAGRNGAGQGE